MNKIFVIGFPKSGTSSIQTSLTNAGISSIHWGTDKIYLLAPVFKNPRTNTDLCYLKSTLIKLLPILRRERPYFRTHGPIRKKEQSLIERIIRLDIPGLPAGVGRYDQELKKWYIQHKNNMLDFFSKKNNFLLFDIEKDNENKLKKFLDIPNISWVHKNKSWTTHKGQIL